jgi:hypothetical protein
MASKRWNRRRIVAIREFGMVFSGDAFFRSALDLL